MSEDNSGDSGARCARPIRASGVAVVITDPSGVERRLPLAQTELRSLRAILAATLVDTSRAAAFFADGPGNHTRKGGGVATARFARDLGRFLARKTVIGARSITTFRREHGADDDDVTWHALIGGGSANVTRAI